MTSLTVRSVALAVCLSLGAVGLAYATRSEAIPLRTPLSELPMAIDAWHGTSVDPLEPAVVTVLGVTEYVNRIYRDDAARRAVSLYVGYYASQRQGESIHSPLNCLPGSGWQPTASGRLSVPLPAIGASPERTIDINRYVVQKMGDSMLVLYWYQSHGRVVASEYWGKVYMVTDAIRTNRTDAALVRIVVPIDPGDPAGAKAAETIGVEFVRALFPQLSRHLPS